jgi:NAD(P)-dependent dehydrogenase (short-subunit alcohol dehydrogenase family)
VRAVVTGASSGLGRAFVEELGRRQARVVAADVDEEGLAETARIARGAGAREVLCKRCDVRDAAQVIALAEAADVAFGGTDLVINNAGVAVAGAVGEAPLEDWKWVIDVNLWGVIYGCHAFIPRLRAQKRGHVINVASAAGLLSAPEMGPYNVTKAGVVALSETMSAELSGSGVGVTVLCPMFFPTNIGVSGRFTNPKQRATAAKLLERSHWTPGQVADFALRAADKNQLYAVPMPAGRWMWRLKRVHPEGFTGLARAVTRLRDLGPPMR